MQGRTRLLALLVVVVAGLLSFSACGGGGGHTIVVPPTVAITPTTGNVPVGGTAIFSVKVTNATNTAVTWQVNGMAGGNATTTGSISTSGVFTAPATPPTANGGVVSITAVSQQDNRTTSNTASITIIAAQGVLVSPSLVVVAGGGLQSFTATQGGNPIAVTWSASAGSIDALGNFTAPLIPPTGGVVTITAKTATNQTGTASATIQLANLLPAGHYAFAFSGTDFDSATVASPTLAVAAGSFQTNGSGTIESGGEYTYNGSACGEAGDTITGGTYAIGGDGRGTATIQTKLCGAFNWSFVMTSPTSALLIEFDSSTTGSFFITGSGTIDAQTITAVSNGNYVFNLSGVDGNGPVAIAGSFTGAGGGNIGPGIWDYNEAGVMLTGTNGDTSLTGLYTVVDANGQGQITLTSSALATSLSFYFYVVDGTHLKIVEFDHVAATAGDVFSAAAAPALANSNYAFTVAGESAIYPVFTVGGVFVSNGDGNLTSGKQDFENTIGNNGNEALGSSPYTITSVSGLSRGTLSLNGSNGFRFVFYVAANGSVQLVENANQDGGFVSSGAAYPQSAIALTGGSYGINLTGVDLSTAGVEEDVSGQLTSSSSGAVSFGTLDINNAANIVDGLFPNIALLSSSTLGTQSAIGYGNNGNLVPNLSHTDAFGLSVYVIDSQTALISENDHNRIAIGTLVKQF